MKKFSILIFDPRCKHYPEYDSEVKILNLTSIYKPSQLYKELILNEYDLVILLKVNHSEKRRLIEVIDNIRPNMKKLFLKKPLANLTGFLKTVDR